MLGRVGVAPPIGGLLFDVWNVTVAQIAPVIPYLLLVLILIFRPTGLMGTREHYKASEGATISLFHLMLDTKSATSWIVAVLLLAGGFILFRRTWPVVGMAWRDAIVCAQVAEKTK